MARGHAFPDHPLGWEELIVREDPSVVGDDQKFAARGQDSLALEMLFPADSRTIEIAKNMVQEQLASV